MRVATMCGSHRAGSTNDVVLSAFEATLIQLGHEIERVDVSEDAPSFRPERADTPPDVIQRIHQSVVDTDAVAFAVPEYAGGPPGWVKNATDWMVGLSTLYQRPTVVMSAATGGGKHAIEHLVRTLTWQGAIVVATHGVSAPATKVTAGDLTHAGDLSEIAALAHTLATAVAGGESKANELACAALQPLGIDRFDRRT